MKNKTNIIKLANPATLKIATILEPLVSAMEYGVENFPESQLRRELPNEVPLPQPTCQLYDGP